MTNAFQEQDTQQPSSGRRSEDGSGQDDAPIVLDLPDVERDDAGIPTFVFKDALRPGDKPSRDHKTLEVVLLWREAVMSVGHYAYPRGITVGDAAKNDFRVACEGLPADRFHLLDETDGHFVVNWTDEMAFEVRNEEGFIHDKAALASRQQVAVSTVAGAAGVDCTRYQYRIDLHDRVAVQVGEVTFVIQYVSPARILQTSIWRTIDFYFTKVLSLSFLAHAFMVIALLLTPIDPAGLSEDLFKNPNRFAQLILREQEQAPKPKKRFELSGKKEGARHKDKEGKFGKPEEQKKDALASVKGAPRVDPNKREKDRQIAMESGIFKALRGDKLGAASNVLGPGGLGTGINNALGGLRGTAMGTAGGAGGLGSRGTGPGGGGNSLGIGGLGSGTGRGTGGLGNVDLGGRGKGRYQVTAGRTITKGCLNQEVVLRVLHRVQSQAKYCYEKELTRNPNLSGKVTTVFRIGPTGAVQSVTVATTTMNNPNVETCLQRVIQRLRFPPCAGGGIADVTYPWIFKSGGS